MEADAQLEWFLLDDIYIWIKCKIYPECYGSRKTNDKKPDDTK